MPLILRYAAGAFFILHGLVHLLYFGQARGLFSIAPGLAWPNSSWLFSQVFSPRVARLLASAVLLLVALGFVIGGLAMILNQSWASQVTIEAAIFSALTFLLLWDGKLRSLHDQGGIGVLIDMVALTLI